MTEAPSSSTNESDNSQRRYEQRSASRLRLAKVAAIFFATVAVVLVIQLVAGFAKVPGASMDPTLKVGDRVLINKLGTAKRNSIVALDGSKLQEVGAPDQLLFKRVIAAGGDTVEIRDRAILVNGSSIKEPAIPADAPLADIAPLRLAPGYLWVIGDNIANSQDSRDFGSIPTSSVEGVVWVKDLPF